MTDSGADTVNFIYTDNVVTGQVVTGRIQDLDYSRDKIQIEGVTIDLRKPPSNVKFFKYKCAPENGKIDPKYDDQLWILIETSGGGHLFYALAGSRKDEYHFLKGSEVPDFSKLEEVRFVDPVNYVPYKYYKNGGYNKIDAKRMPMVKRSTMSMAPMVRI